jgi:putative transposase
VEEAASERRALIWSAGVLAREALSNTLSTGGNAAMTATGWRSHGHLPHCDDRGLVQHIIFGLNDGFRAPPPSIEGASERAQWADREFDGGRGSRLLAKTQHAQTVQDCLLHGDGERYALAAWCVMPTHVHVVVEQAEGHTLSDVVQKWKSISAHAINKLEGRKGRLWQPEYFDRFMRSEQQFGWTVAYVENNPVAARLVEKPEDWRFSSAWWREYAGEDARAP